LHGGNDDDTLSGDNGDDVLIGGAGADILIGGAGADGFDFRDATVETDRIEDFSSADGDKIDLTGRGLTFADLVITTEGENAFTTVTLGNGANAQKIQFTNLLTTDITADMFLLT
jgi:Ca2+-binding RTX toxin-like protein